MKRLIFIIFLFLSSSLYSQKIKNVCGEYTYVAPEEMTLADAKRVSVERAKLEALSQEYGSVIYQDNQSLVRNSNEKSSIDFFSLSGSDVKGEWIETTKGPIYEISILDEISFVVKVSICGNTREIKRAGIDFDVKILRNEANIRNEDDKFKDGDDVFLYFKSPVKGYLAVYLVDESSAVSCLLPYRRSQTGIESVNANQEYIFFNRKLSDGSIDYQADSYSLYSDKQSEANYFFIVFSPNEFTKANDKISAAEMSLPRQTDMNSFRKWLTNVRVKDPAMQVMQKSVLITKQ